MIIPIPNQPIDLEPNLPDDCNLGDQKNYCALYNIGDYLYWQGKQTPCGDDINCAPQFGFNLVENGDFSLDLSSWINSGAFYWAAGVAMANTASSENLTQSIPSLISGQSYSVTYTVKNFTSGRVRVNLGGGTWGTARTANGTYTETITCGSTDTNIKFNTSTGASNGFVGGIDDVIITGDSGCYTPSGGWALGESACHTPGSLDNLTLDVTPVDGTYTYQIIITVTGITAGSLQVFDVGGTFYGTITADGVYTYYGIINGDQLIFTADSAFDGCIDEINIYELRSDIQVHLTDNDGAILEDISSSLTYSQDRLIVKYQLTTAGCFRIAIEDLCNADSIALLSEMSLDVGFDNVGNWSFDEQVSGGVASTTTVTGSKLRQTHSAAGSGLTSSMAKQTKAWTTGYYIARIELTTGTVQGTTPYIALITPDGTVNGWHTYPIAQSVASNSNYTKNLIIHVLNESPSTKDGINMYNKFGILLQSTGVNGNVFELTSFSIKISALDTTTFPWLSNCISVATEHDCAKLIQGWEQSDTSTLNRLGFLFPDSSGGAFRISSRYRFLKFNPYYPTDGEDYDFSDGSLENVYVKKDKYYEALWDYIDESATDAMSTAILCRQFQIDGVDYKAKLEDVKPEWDRDGRQNLAQVRMLIRKKTSTIYNSKL